jgi:hypothetical protein
MSDQEPTKVKASQHESYAAYTGLAILLPGIAWILGLIFMTKDNKLDRKLGEHVLAFSILFMIIYGLGWTVWMALQPSSVPTYVPY